MSSKSYLLKCAVWGHTDNHWTVCRSAVILLNLAEYEWVSVCLCVRLWCLYTVFPSQSHQSIGTEFLICIFSFCWSISPFESIRASSNQIIAVNVFQCLLFSFYLCFPFIYLEAEQIKMKGNCVWKRKKKWYMFLQGNLNWECGWFSQAPGDSREERKILGSFGPNALQTVWPSEAACRSAGIPAQAATGIPVVAERDGAAP